MGRCAPFFLGGGPLCLGVCPLFSGCVSLIGRFEAVRESDFQSTFLKRVAKLCPVVPVLRGTRPGTSARRPKIKGHTFRSYNKGPLPQGLKRDAPTCHPLQGHPLSAPLCVCSPFSCFVRGGDPTPHSDNSLRRAKQTTSLNKTGYPGGCPRQGSGVIQAFPSARRIAVTTAIQLEKSCIGPGPARCTYCVTKQLLPELRLPGWGAFRNTLPTHGLGSHFPPPTPACPTVQSMFHTGCSSQMAAQRIPDYGSQFAQKTKAPGRSPTHAADVRRGNLRQQHG